MKIDPDVIFKSVLKSIEVYCTNSTTLPHWLYITPELYNSLPFKAEVFYEGETYDGRKLLMISTEKMLGSIHEYLKENSE